MKGWGGGPPGIEHGQHGETAGNPFNSLCSLCIGPVEVIKLTIGEMLVFLQQLMHSGIDGEGCGRGLIFVSKHGEVNVEPFVRE